MRKRKKDKEMKNKSENLKRKEMTEKGRKEEGTNIMKYKRGNK